MIRYSDLILGGILFYISAGLLLVILSRSYDYVGSNIPLISVLLTNFLTGALFGNLFCEKFDEIRGYLLVPWTVRPILLSKNISLIFLSVLLPLPVIITASLFIQSELQDYINSVLYFITSIPVCMLLGNWVSISRRTLSSAANMSFLQWVIVSVSPVPYLIFIGWMNSLSLCLFFSAISLIVWYQYELPLIENKFRTVLYKISQI